MTDEEYIEDAADFGYFQEDEDFDNDEFFDKNCLLELTKDYFQKFYLLILTENFIFSKLSCKIGSEISIYAF